MILHVWNHGGQSYLAERISGREKTAVVSIYCSYDSDIVERWKGAGSL